MMLRLSVQTVRNIFAEHAMMQYIQVEREEATNFVAYTITMRKE